MYISPIEIIYGELETQFEDMIMQAVRKTGVNVDKEELIKALQYDRDQYIKGYQDGKKESDWISVDGGLPEEETDVLICNENGDIALSRGSYSTEVENDFIWYISEWRFGKVVAWMSLPEPYKGGK